MYFQHFSLFAKARRAFEGVAPSLQHALDVAGNTKCHQATTVPQCLEGIAHGVRLPEFGVGFGAVGIEIHHVHAAQCVLLWVGLLAIRQRAALKIEHSEVRLSGACIISRLISRVSLASRSSNIHMRVELSQQRRVNRARLKGDVVDACIGILLQ